MEGLGVTNFPRDLTEWFYTQDAVFATLYALLALRLGVEVYRSEQKDVLNKFKGWVTIFATVGCIARVFYVVLVDLVAELPPWVGHWLRAFNEIAWFGAFCVLIVFWWELLTTVKKHTVTVVAFQRRLVVIILGFAVLRFARLAFEILEMKPLYIAFKAACCVYIGCLIGLGK